MTPQSLPELDTAAFRRAVAVALGLPVDGEPPRAAAQTAAVAPPPPPAAAAAEPHPAWRAA